MNPENNPYNPNPYNHIISDKEYTTLIPEIPAKGIHGVRVFRKEIDPTYYTRQSFMETYGKGRNLPSPITFSPYDL